MLAAIGLTSLCGCNDIDSNYDEIVPDSYYTIISLKENGVQDVVMSIADTGFDREVPVLKGGLHTDEVVEVMVEAPGRPGLTRIITTGRALTTRFSLHQCTASQTIIWRSAPVRPENRCM